MGKQEKSASQFEHMLLALLAGESMSGYEIRKLLVSTPMAHFSDSPGSVYPALQRLESRGLVRSGEESVGKRKRQRYSLTAKGNSAVQAWLRKPLTREDVMYDIDDLFLRFAFMQPLPKRKVIAFLGDLEKHLQEHVVSMKQFLAGVRDSMPLPGRLAMESGIESYEGMVRWTRRAKKEIASV